jgi:hypothetical protein
MSDRVHIFKGTAARRRSKKVTTEDGRGWTSQPDGVDAGDIMVEIDIGRIIDELGERALKSKRRTSRAMNGAIVARASNVRRIIKQGDKL